MMNEIANEFTIYEVEKLREFFLEALKREEPLTLDMSKVEKIDMVGIQLLLSLVKTADERGKKVELVNIPDGVLHQIKTCHCEQALGVGNA